MKKSCTAIGIFLFVIMVALTTFTVSPVLSKDEGNLLYSVEANSIWILDKATKKIIFMKFTAPSEVWKSNTAPIPAEFNVEHCQLKAVGRVGDFAFLIDQSKGLVTFFEAQKDHTVKSYIVVPVNQDFK